MICGGGGGLVWCGLRGRGRGEGEEDLCAPQRRRRCQLAPLFLSLLGGGFLFYSTLLFTFYHFTTISSTIIPTTSKHNWSLQLSAIPCVNTAMAFPSRSRRFTNSASDGAPTISHVEGMGGILRRLVHPPRAICSRFGHLSKRSCANDWRPVHSSR